MPSKGAQTRIMSPVARGVWRMIAVEASSLLYEVIELLGGDDERSEAPAAAEAAIGISVEGLSNGLTMASATLAGCGRGGELEPPTPEG